MSIPIVNLCKRKLKSGKTQFYLDYRLNGKRKRISAGFDRTTAIRIQSEVQYNFSLGNYNIPSDRINRISIPKLIDEFCHDKLNTIRPQSLNRYKNFFFQFNKFFELNFPDAHTDITGITLPYIRENINFLTTQPIKANKPWAPKTIGSFITIIKMLMSFAMKQKYITINPTTELVIPRKIVKVKAEYYTANELSQIYKTVDSFWVDYLKFIQYTGLRKGELINLKWKNVHLKETLSHIEIKSDEHWKTKTGQERIVPLPKTAIEILVNQKKKPQRSIYVFPGKNGEIQHPDRIYRALIKATNVVGIKGKIHTFRHTYASNLVMSGASLYDVKKLLGHSDIKSTEIYSHLADDHLQNIVNILD